MNQWGETLISGPLTLDQAARQVRYNGVPVHLTRTEFEILVTLMRAPKRVFTRQQLVDQVWGEQWSHMDHSVNVHVSNLRRKIHDRAPAPPIITTLRGVGYRFDAPVVRGHEPDEPAQQIGSLKGEVTEGAGSTVGAMTLTLVFNADFILVELLPPVPEHLERLHRQIGEFVPPAPGVDQGIAGLLLRTLDAAGIRELSGITEVVLDDGSRMPARSHTILSREPNGSLRGLVTQLFFSSPVSGESYPASDSVDSTFDSHTMSSR